MNTEISDNQTSDQKKVFSFKEAAKYCNFSNSYLYKLTSKHEIPHYKPRGKMLYFDRDELDSFLLQNKITTRQEIEQQAADYCLTGKKG
jgi:excisionase family DNA binding protein